MSHPNTNPPLPLNEPPPDEVMPLAAFENLMTSTDLDEFYRYYDSDGTVDLEDTYAGSSTSSIADSDSGSDEWPEDPNADIRAAERQDRAAASRHNNQSLQDLIFDTEVVLERLSIAAQPLLEEQPMGTRIVLANQAVDVFERYGAHGSMFRFSDDVKRFLEGGERVRRAGVQGRDRTKDAVLRFSHDEADQGKDKETRTKVRSKRKDSSGREGPRKERKVGGDTSSSSSAGKTRRVKAVTETGQSVAAGSQENVEGTDKQNGDGKLKPTIPHLQTGSMDLQIPPITTLEGRTILSPISPATALARFNLNSPTLQPSSQPANQHAYSCTTHPTLNAHLATQPYNPISLTFTWPATSRQNAHPTMPTPGLLDALNNILHLYNAEGRFMLSYYVRKFDTPSEFNGLGTAGGNLPNNLNNSAQNVEPPHALFRLGIAQYLWGKIGKVIDNKEVDELGLNPEARRLFGEVWERHPSTAAWWHHSLPSSQEKDDEETDAYAHESDFDSDVSAYDANDPADTAAERGRKRRRRIERAHRRQKREKIEAKKRESARGGLNAWEKEILARATNVSLQTVDAYWDDMREKTKAWGAMKMWCAAMEKRMIRKAKVEGRW